MATQVTLTAKNIRGKKAVVRTVAVDSCEDRPQHWQDIPEDDTAPALELYVYDNQKLEITEADMEDK